MDHLPNNAVKRMTKKMIVGGSIISHRDEPSGWSPYTLVQFMCPTLGK